MITLSSFSKKKEVNNFDLSHATPMTQISKISQQTCIKKNSINFRHFVIKVSHH